MQLKEALRKIQKDKCIIPVLTEPMAVSYVDPPDIDRASKSKTKSALSSDLRQDFLTHLKTQQ